MIHALLVFCRLTLGALLMWSGLSKLRDTYAFLEVIYEYRIVGAISGIALAMVLPWLEVILAIFAFFKIFIVTTLAFITALSILFLGIHTAAIARGLNVDCGCGIDFISPAASEHAPWIAMVPAATLLTVSVVGIVALRKGNGS